jgi:GNAT superfamily N-acetyltransferase
MEIVQAETGQHLDDIRQLFAEYLEWVRTSLGIDLDYQGVQAELRGLPGKYAPPSGRLLLALDGSHAAGCVAVRPMEEGICELKRMYVRPQYRGQGLGRALGERAIVEARSAGYRLMRLDTHQDLSVARAIYTALGFHETGPYYSVPPDVLRLTVFMEKTLT